MISGNSNQAIGPQRTWAHEEDALLLGMERANANSRFAVDFVLDMAISLEVVGPKYQVRGFCA